MINAGIKSLHHSETEGYLKHVMQQLTLSIIDGLVSIFVHI